MRQRSDAQYATTSTKVGYGGETGLSVFHSRPPIQVVSESGFVNTFTAIGFNMSMDLSGYLSIPATCILRDDVPGNEHCSSMG